MQETNESLGVYLKRSREGKNVSIEQVAYATRISLKMLRALEDDAHTALPAPTFVRGYLQAYAKYIRIDTQDLLLRYQHHLATSPDHKRNTIRSHYLYVRERYQEKRRLVLVIVLFATMLSVAGTYFLLKAKRDHHKRLAQTTAEIQKGENKNASPALPSALVPPTPSEKVAEILDKDKKDVKTEAKVDTKTETKTADVIAKTTHTQTEVKTAPAPVVAPPTAAAPKPTTTATATQMQAVTETAAKVADVKKTYNLLLKTDQDVWLRFQTDQDGVRDLTLRAGKAIMLHADSVIKIFSGNLAVIKGTLNGEAISLAPSSRIKSVVLPASETANYPLPLFPQFQPKPDAPRASTTQDQTGSTTPPANNAAQ
ncbi:MAG: helix-turn-helix domain-containing protein [Bacteriovoracia bacterium]